MCVNCWVLSTLCNPTDCSPPGFPVPRIFLGKNTGVGCHSLLQGIFPTQGSNPGLLRCRWILDGLSHQGSPLGSMDESFNVCASCPVPSHRRVCSRPGASLHENLILPFSYLPRGPRDHERPTNIILLPPQPLYLNTTTTPTLAVFPLPNCSREWRVNWVSRPPSPPPTKPRGCLGAGPLSPWQRPTQSILPAQLSELLRVAWGALPQEIQLSHLTSGSTTHCPDVVGFWGPEMEGPGQLSTLSPRQSPTELTSPLGLHLQLLITHLAHGIKLSACHTPGPHTHL